MGHELVEKGVDPLELMELDETARRLRALPARAWPAASANAYAGSPEPGIREPGSREPESREPGSREPGSHEPRRGHAPARLQRSGVGELL